MRISKLFLTVIIFMMTLGGHAGVKWHWQEGTIVPESPVRPDGQKHVVGMALDPIPVVRVGFVGLGMRGPGAVQRFTYIPGVEIKGLCDYEDGRARACQRFLRSAGLPPADIYSGADGYKALCEREDIDLIYVAADWDHHFPIAKYALEQNKNVAVEVPSVMDVTQCWELINLSEKNRKHCMILENCCYDWYEMSALNMAKHGVFGEVVRVAGAYIHNLTPYWDEYWKNPDGSDPDKLGWRLKYNREHRGDLYATHGLGPVAQVLDIHRGDRINTLVAMDTKSAVGAQLVENKTGKECKDFRSGDQTSTLMRTQNGKVIQIEHNVMTFQPYNRLYQITGTTGYATKYPDEHFAMDITTLDDVLLPLSDTRDLKATPDNQPLRLSSMAPWKDMPKGNQPHSFMSNEEQKALCTIYEHPILKKYGAMAREVGGHGGMDFIMDSRLVYCLQNGLPLDMDVYDLAEWCCLGELGELSMDHNNASVAFPDFTRGYWNLQKGFRHAYADVEKEKATETAAKEATASIKEMVVKKKLWEKYDKAEVKANKKK